MNSGRTSRWRVVPVLTTMLAIAVASTAKAQIASVQTNVFNFSGSLTAPNYNFVANSISVINPTFFAMTTGGTGGIYSVHAFVPNLQPFGHVLGGRPTGLAFGDANAFLVGVQANGRFFSLSNTGNYALLHSFSDDDFNLGTPQGTLLNTGITVYGTSTNGGESAHGMIYRINADGSNATDLFEFNSVAGGQSPAGGLVTDGFALYGTTQFGGEFNAGEIFKINFDGSGFQILHSFNGLDGANPFATLSFRNDTLYGTTVNGGSDDLGTIFQIRIDGTGFHSLHSFNGADGAHPMGSLGLSTLLFEPPNAPPAFGGLGIVGTTNNGGTADDGTVFWIQPDGTFHSLHSFSGPDGAHPQGGMIWEGPFSNAFYGTTVDGGTGGGTLFQIALLPEPSTIAMGLIAAAGSWFFMRLRKRP